MVKNTNSSQEKDVLFQKLGETWYAFTQIGEEIVFSPLPPGMDPKKIKLELYDVIEDHLEKVAKHLKDDSIAA